MARRARVKVLCDEEERVIAVHDGYKRLGCLHTRKVEKMKEHLRIVDEIDCEGWLIYILCRKRILFRWRQAHGTGLLYRAQRST